MISLRSYDCVCVCVYTHTHTQEYYLAIKKNEVMLSAATRMDLESIILSEVRQREIYTV